MNWVVYMKMKGIYCGSVMYLEIVFPIWFIFISFTLRPMKRATFYWFHSWNLALTRFFKTEDWMRKKNDRRRRRSSASVRKDAVDAHRSMAQRGRGEGGKGVRTDIVGVGAPPNFHRAYSRENISGKRRRDQESWSVPRRELSFVDVIVSIS